MGWVLPKWRLYLVLHQHFYMNTELLMAVFVQSRSITLVWYRKENLVIYIEFNDTTISNFIL